MIRNQHYYTVPLHQEAFPWDAVFLSGHRSTHCPCWKTVSRLICTGFELMGREGSSQEMERLMSPSVFCLLGNNHSSPSNILSIGCCRLALPQYQSREIEYSRAHWTVNRITFQHPHMHTCSHLFTLQNLIPCTRGDRCVQCNMLPSVACQKAQWRHLDT